VAKKRSFALAVRRESSGAGRGPRGAEPTPLLAEARERWSRCEEAEDSQRKRILVAKSFRQGKQWPDAVKIAREGGNAIAGMPPQPPRPCLTVDRLSQPLRQVSNAIKTASITFTVLPNGDGADEDVADILSGYLRRVHNQARSESPIEWAADQAVEGGIGWFRIRTEYVYPTWTGEPKPEMNDQELRLERIPNNLSVYCDPSAQKPTRSDALFMFVTEDLSRDEYDMRWGKRTNYASLDAFAATGDTQGWVSDKIVRVAEYWRMTFEEQPWYQLRSGQIQQGEPPKGADVLWQRTIRKSIVKGSIINAIEELEELPWVGSRIPLVPILGEEFNIDGQAYLRGMIEEGMDAQRMVNYTYSGAVEIFSLAPKSPFVVAEGQLGQYGKIWETANTYNYAYLPYVPVSLLGQPVPPPQRDVSEAPIQAAVMLMQKSEEAIQATTSLYAPSLGQIDPHKNSGVAITQLQNQGDLGTAHFIDNVNRAVVYAAEQMLEVIPKITRPGQILHILGLDDEPDKVMVGHPYTEGPGGQPMPAPGISPELAQVQGSLYKFYDLNNGRYAVTATVGKSTATRAQEGAAALGQLIPHLPPPMAAAIMPDYVEQLSFPGAHQVAEKLRRFEPPDPEALQQIPEQFRGQVQALMQQNQQLQQQAQTDAAKQQATLQKAQLDAQVELQKAQLQSQTQLEIARINAQAGLVEAEVKAANQDADRRIRVLEQMIGVEKEARLAEAAAVKDREAHLHAAATQGREHAHEHAVLAHEAQNAVTQAALAVNQPQNQPQNQPEAGV